MGNYRREVKFRRDLFNQIQELKGLHARVCMYSIEFVGTSY